MNKKSNHLCNWAVPALLILTLALVPFFSGCIGFESRTNISIDAPESMEVAGRRVETLVIELSPIEADAKNVVINLSAPPGISLTDPHTGFQQYSVGIKKIPKGKNEIIYFNYSATFVSDEYDLILETKADNSNSSKRIIKINLSIPVPEWQVGEYWILNQTMGDFAGTRLQQVLRKESHNGKEVYVIKDTLAREVSGNYRLYYYGVNDLVHIKTEYYEDNKIIEKMTEEVDPPSSIYGFPFKVGKVWGWNGTISGIGGTEFNGEVLDRTKISIKGKNYDVYKIRLKYTYPLGTGIWEILYSPEIRGVVKETGTINMGGLVKESNTELVRHDLPPNEPPDIQPAAQLLQGWKSHVDKDFGIRFNYPGDWRLNKTSNSYITLENPKTKATIFITKEPVGKMTLEDYGRKVKNDLYINEENYTEVNGRKGYRISANIYGAIYAVFFVANDNGYMIFNIYQVYGGIDFPPETLEIINSFIIEEPVVYTPLERK